MSNLIPFVIDETPRGERSFDIFSRLLKERIVFVGASLEVDMANTVIAQLLYLEKESKTEDINMYINCWGGQVVAALSIIDTMNHVKPDVTTTVVGVAASGGAWLLSAGAKGKRYALQNADILLHQPHVQEMGGQVSDIDITAKHLVKRRERLFEIIAKQSGKTKSQIEKDFDRDFWMSAQEAKQYGIVDKILK